MYMSKTTIIGLGLTGNSIGLALKRAFGAEGMRVTGFDPDKQREALALRRYASVDEIAPDLERAVRGAVLVIISTPLSAVAEVMQALEPFLELGAVVTDTLPLKEPVLALAGELLGSKASFVGGHPFSLTVDLDVAGDDVTPGADIFRDAPWCIMPSPTARNDALNTVINLAENLGGKPIFIDPIEHDSFMAAVSHLPVVASGAFMEAVAGSPAWSDMSGLAHGRFRGVSEGVAANPQVLAETLHQNRNLLVHWIDSYINALYELRTVINSGERDGLEKALGKAHSARAVWDAGDQSEEEARLHAELRQSISDARPSQALMGTYITEKLFRKRERGQ
jgi:prephenate dehydrogenase